MATLYSTISKTQLLLSKVSIQSCSPFSKLHRRIPLVLPLKNPPRHNHHHCCLCTATASSISKQELRIRSPELVAAEYAELNLPSFNPPEMGLVRARQHVNPLSASMSVSVPVPDWNKVFKDPKLPLMVDIGTGSGRFLLWLARRNPDSNNYLGLEIRQKLVERAEYWAKPLALSNIHFLFANATVSFKEIVSTYPGPLTLVSILCPDPHFKKRHQKRRVVQKPLVESIVDNLVLGGQVFIQSDVLQVAVDMRNHFDVHSDKLLHVDCLQTQLLCDEEGWLMNNPFGIRTEREIHAEVEGAKIYRRLYQKQI